MIRLVAFLPLLCAALVLGPAGSSPASAMCGGNIFMTCPPSAESTRPKKVRPPPREPRHRKPKAMKQASL